MMTGYVNSQYMRSCAIAVMHAARVIRRSIEPRKALASRGEQIIGSVLYGLPVDPHASAVLNVIWEASNGQWLGGYQTIGFNADPLGRADDWREVFYRHVVPEGAARVWFQFDAGSLAAQEFVEFKASYFGKVGGE